MARPRPDSEGLNARTRGISCRGRVLGDPVTCSLDAEANRWVAEHTSDDPHLPPPAPPRDRTPVDGRQCKPTDSDGLVATAFGRLPPEAIPALRRSGKLNAFGGLGGPQGPEQRRAVRQRNGTMSMVVMALTLEEVVAAEDERRQLEAEARRHRAELARAAEKESQRPLVPRSDLPANVVVSGRSVMSSEPIDDTPEPDVPAWVAWMREEDRYDRLADVVRPLADVDEERAWEVAHGLEPGTLAAEREAQARAESERKELARQASEAADLEQEWSAEIAERRAAGEGFEADGPKCGNPNGCENVVQGGRGRRCRACYAYRRLHRGEERPLALISRERRRRAA